MTHAQEMAALFARLRDSQLAAALPSYLRAQRWFGAKARTIVDVQLADLVPFSAAALCFVDLVYDDGGRDAYLLPLAVATGAQANAVRASTQQAIIEDDGDAVIYDAVYDPAFCTALLDAIGAAQPSPTDDGAFVATPTSAFTRLHGAGPLVPRISQAEQSNTSIIYGDQLILKLFRRVVRGINPDLEIGRYLTEQGQFSQIAPVAGSLAFERAGHAPVTLGVLLGYVPNQSDAWAFMLGMLADLRTRIAAGDTAPAAPESHAATVSADVARWYGPTLAAAQQLGRRTAEMHRALAAPTDDPAFASVPFSADDARAEVAAMNVLADQVFGDVRARIASQSARVQADLRTILDREPHIRARFDALTQQPLTALRTRTHGDYHLGQVLATPDGDFVIIDFEGEPARTLDERRAKRSPLRDVAGMLRSFEYAAASAFAGDAPLEGWARSWAAWAAAAFLQSYRETAGNTAFLPREQAEFDALLDAYSIEKAVYELQYELNNRPDWVRIPAQGILSLITPDK